jgi:TonB family protein
MTFELAVIARSSLVLAIGFAMVAALRRQPAAFRHSILAAAIVLAAVQPLANRLMPAWFIPSPWTSASITAAPPDAATVDTATSFEILVPETAASASIDAAAVALWVWIGGVAISLLAITVAAAWLVWLGRRGRPAEGEWSAIAAELSQSLSIARPIRLRITRHHAVLATWGVLRPVILLPRDAATWPAERIRVVLAHELAHIARRDWVVHIAAEVSRAIYWFNPLFWIACARLRRDSEHACDDVVLETGISNTSYASHLVELARAFRAHGRTWLPAPSMARPSTLERRIRTMLNPQRDLRPLSPPARIAVVLVLLAVALPIAAATRHAGAPGGVLRDPSGRVLPAATVRLSAIGTEAIHEVQTDSSGTFQFPEIADGDYMISARLPGFLSARQRVRVSSSMAPLNMIMQIGTLTETISIRAGDAGTPVALKPALPMPQPPPCGSTEVGGNLKPPRKLRDVRPHYKQALIDSRVEGNILLQAVIGIDGKVRNVEVVSPVNVDLEEAAIAAVSQWEFTPTYLNCNAVEVRMFVTARFSLEQ